LFLAGKVEETPKKCRDIIKTARSLLTDAQFEAFGEDPKVSTTVNQLDFGQKNHTFMLIINYNYYFTATVIPGSAEGFMGRVSRFSACASDDLSTVKLIVFRPIRNAFTTLAGYGSKLL